MLPPSRLLLVLLWQPLLLLLLSFSCCEGTAAAPELIHQHHHLNTSLCVSMFFLSHAFRIEAQTEYELSQVLPVLCYTNDCTEHLQTHIYQQHRECLLAGTDTTVGDLYIKKQYIGTRSVLGLCITVVGSASAARFYSPTLSELDSRLHAFCEEHMISHTPVPDAASEQEGVGGEESEFAKLRAFVVAKCFPSDTDTDTGSGEFEPLQQRFFPLSPSLVTSQLSRVAQSPPGSSSSLPNKQKNKAINTPATLRKVIHAMRRTNTHTASNGLLLIPRHRLALCVPPKSGLVSMLIALLAILGNHPNALCGCKGQEGEQLKFGCLRMSQLRHYSHPMYEGMVYLNDAIQFSDRKSDSDSDSEFSSGAEQLLHAAFTDPEWRSVMVVRDPWRRAISAFHEDNGYQAWVNLSSSSHSHGDGGGNLVAKRRAEFLNYLSNSMYFNHGLPASSFCNLQQGLRYDHYLDIASGMTGLTQVLAHTSPPVPPEVFSTGWENCTVGGGGSLLEARLRSSHAWSEGRRKLDDVYCTPQLVRAAIRHFQEDYRLLLPLLREQQEREGGREGEGGGGGVFPVLPRCLPQEAVLDWMLEGD